MDTVTLIAESADDALARVRALGPDAVVMKVREQRPAGLARLWSKPQLEVVAALPKPAAPAENPLVTDILRRITQLNQQLPQMPESDRSAAESILGRLSGKAAPAESAPPPGASASTAAALPDLSISLQKLLAAGLLPQQAQSLLEHMGQTGAPLTGESLKAALRELWKEPAWMRTSAEPRLHVLMGAPGAGKTTALCKWLAQEVLVNGYRAEVWRLDGLRANTAEFLGVQCEALNVPLHRGWTEDARLAAEVGFVDIPGIDWQDPAAMQNLATQVAKFSSPVLHLVLNLAYETPVLLAQLRAFSRLQVRDLVFTHLDEEPRAGKTLNCLMGTKYTLSYVSAGQNIPGSFQKPSSDWLAQEILQQNGTAMKSVLSSDWQNSCSTENAL